MPNPGGKSVHELGTTTVQNSSNDDVQTGRQADNRKSDRQTDRKSDRPQT